MAWRRGDRRRLACRRNARRPRAVAEAAPTTPAPRAGRAQRPTPRSSSCACTPAAWRRNSLLAHSSSPQDGRRIGCGNNGPSMSVRPPTVSLAAVTAEGPASGRRPDVERDYHLNHAKGAVWPPDRQVPDSLGAWICGSLSPSR
jgi:hypothetical protein